MIGNLLASAILVLADPAPPPMLPKTAALLEELKQSCTMKATGGAEFSCKMLALRICRMSKYQNVPKLPACA